MMVLKLKQWLCGVFTNHSIGGRILPWGRCVAYCENCRKQFGPVWAYSSKNGKFIPDADVNIEIEEQLKKEML